MKPKTALILNWVISIIFAIVIIFSDSLFGTENENLTFWLIAAWFIPFTLLTAAGKSDKS
jgi:ABC-type multidrug transport system permease subunit